MNDLIAGNKKDMNFIKNNKILFDMKWDMSPNPRHCHHCKVFVVVCFIFVQL